VVVLTSVTVPMDDKRYRYRCLQVFETDHHLYICCIIHPAVDSIRPRERQPVCVSFALPVPSLSRKHPAGGRRRHQRRDHSGHCEHHQDQRSEVKIFPNDQSGPRACRRGCGGAVVGAGVYPQMYHA
jgi:hypothetical protein